jgi:hypothetical protein
MPLGLFARRDPWWDSEGPAARRARRHRQVVAFIAFVTSLTAAVGAGYVWAFHLGLAGPLGVALPIG